MFLFEATAANTGATTLKVGTLDAVTIRKNHDRDLVTGDIESGQQVLVIYSAAEDIFQMLSQRADPSVVFTAIGDILYRNSSNANAILAAGAEDTVILSNGTGIAWSATPVATGTQTLWIPAGAMRPTVTNGAASLTDIETTAGNPDIHVSPFSGAADEALQFSVHFPKGWNEGTLTFSYAWSVTAAVTTGVALSVQCVSVSDDGAIDSAYGTAVPVTDDATNAANDLMVSTTSAAVTCAGTPAEGDLTFVRVFRDVSDSNDDLVQDMGLIGVRLFYTLNSANDN